MAMNAVFCRNQGSSQVNSEADETKSDPLLDAHAIQAHTCSAHMMPKNTVGTCYLQL